MAGNVVVDTVYWDNDGPERNHQFIPIMSPKGIQPVHFVITSETWTGAYTHYYNQRTHPCLGDEAVCEGCQRRYARRWKCYLCGIKLPGGRTVIIELTVGALDSCPQLRQDKGNLRGMKITLWRRNEAKNAPVICKLERLKGIESLPAKFDIMESLCRVWGVQTEVDGD